MRPTTFALLLALLLALLVATARPTPAASLLLDAMTDPLPASPCLPVSAQPVVFLGPFCDAAACPPGEIVPFAAPCNLATQDALAGVLRHRQRLAEILGNPDLAASVRVRPDLACAEVGFSDPAGNESDFVYERAGADWNLDLATAGVTALRVPVSGDVSALRPLQVSVGLVDRATYLGASAVVTVTAPGDVVVPFTALAVDSGFDFSGVDVVSVGFGECLDGACPGAGTYAPRSFTVGPFSFDVDLGTPVRTHSWGSLKATYR